MSSCIEEHELVRRLAGRMHPEATTAAAQVDGVAETLSESFKSGESVTLPGFGEFMFT